jgi:hypothetical protein
MDALHALSDAARRTVVGQTLDRCTPIWTSIASLPTVAPTFHKYRVSGRQNALRQRVIPLSDASVSSHGQKVGGATRLCTVSDKYTVAKGAHPGVGRRMG